MKKRLVSAMVIMAVVGIIVGLTACGAQEYKYADDWEAPSEAVGNYPTEKDLRKINPSREIIVDPDYGLMYIRGSIWRVMRDFPVDKWGDFGNIDSVFSVDRKEITPIKELGQHLVWFNSFYDSTNKRVLLLCCPEEEQNFYIARALVQSLIIKGKAPYIEEGVVEYYTEKTAEAEGWFFEKRAFQDERDLAEILVNHYGDEKVFKSASNGELIDLVEGMSKSGMGEKLEATFDVVYSLPPSLKTSEYLPPRWDILGHMLAADKKAANEEIRHTLKFDIKCMFDPPDEYLEELLNY